MLRRIVVLIAALITMDLPVSAETFTFVAIGDMPYGKPAVDHPRFRGLIGQINARKPVFTVHIGDFKSGSSLCSDAMFKEQLDFLNTFEAPLVYTPGDNEWTDCHRDAAGKFDALERLAKLRAMFFIGPQSLGRDPMPIERQGDMMAAHKVFVENARFARGGVHFVTLHVVGSNNGLEPRDRSAANEFFDRDAANLAWLSDSFAKAKRENAKAIVIAMQADMFEFDFGHFGKDEHLTHSGFLNVAERLVREANAFGRPVLLIHGDSHNFRVHTPFRKRAPRLVAVEVFGADQMHAVEVSIDTDDAAVFGFRPLWNAAP